MSAGASLTPRGQRRGLRLLPETLRPSLPRTVPDALLRAGVAIALGVDAYYHIALASGYNIAFPDGLGGGTIFVLQSLTALVAMVFVLGWGGVRSHAAALVVLLMAFVAVVLYRYVDVPALGPIPSMYEPAWYFEKTITAVAEGLGALLALVGALAAWKRQR